MNDCVICGRRMPPDAHHRAKTCSRKCRQALRRQSVRRASARYYQRLKENAK